MGEQVVTVLTLILMGLCGVGIIGLVVFMFASEGLFPFRRLVKKDTSKCVVDITPISVKIVPASKHHNLPKERRSLEVSSNE